MTKATKLAIVLVLIVGAAAVAALSGKLACELLGDGSARVTGQMASYVAIAIAVMAYYGLASHLGKKLGLRSSLYQWVRDTLESMSGKEMK